MEQRLIKEEDGVLFITVEKGGAGSGNFGHAGIPGQRGGSGGHGGGGGGGGGGRTSYERQPSEYGGTYVAGIDKDAARELDGMGFRPNDGGHPTYVSEETPGRVKISPTPEGGWELSGTDAEGMDVEPENFDNILDAAEDAAILAEEGAEAFDE